MKKDIVERLRAPGIADYELDCGVCEDAAKEILALRRFIEKIDKIPAAYIYKTEYSNATLSFRRNQLNDACGYVTEIPLYQMVK